MLRRVTLVRTQLSEERSTSIIRVTRIGELGTTLAVTSNWHTLRRNNTLMMEELRSCETSVLPRAKRHNIREDGILHSHRRDVLTYTSLNIISQYEV
jgi:hypothetical protein